MKLKRLVLENFRQFQGSNNTINLDVTDDKNIVVIHAKNGVGKTTILASLSWCLYGEFDLENPSRILNDNVFEQLAENASASVSVTLDFEDKGIPYTAKRVYYIRKKNNSPEEMDKSFELLVNRKKDSKAPTTINMILHQKLRSFFFFDGERMTHLSKPQNSKDIVNGIRAVMGLEVFERAITHLKNAKKELTIEQNKIDVIGDDALYKEMYAEQQNLQEVIEVKQNELENTNQLIILHKEKLEAISKKLAEFNETKLMQEELIKLKKNKQNLETKHDEKLKNIAEHIAKNAYIALSKELLSDMNEFMEDKRKKGELPSGIAEQFIEDLLEAGKCICGESIEKGDSHYKELKHLLDTTARKQNIDDRFISVTGFIKQHMDYRSEFKSIYDQYHMEKLSIEDELRTTNDRIESLNTEALKKFDGTKYEEQQKSRIYYEEEIELNTKKVGKLEQEILFKEQELNKFKKKIETHDTHNENLSIAQNYIDITQDAITYLEERLQNATNNVRKRLNEKVSILFRKMISADYHASIDDDFALKVQKNSLGSTDLDVSKSTAQSQMASLSFIGSLVSLAKEFEDKGNQHSRGGIYPIVMDAPFGVLDDEYQENFSKHFRDLAPQIIFLVTKTQWTKTIEENLKPYINKEYVLTFHNTRDDLDYSNPSLFIERDGKKIPLAVKDEREFTEIREV